MADEKKLVSVKLKARCIVHGQEREAGEIVELPELADDGKPLAAVFGEIVKAPAAAVSTPAKPDDGK
jgi:hypothetical protein